MKENLIKLKKIIIDKLKKIGTFIKNNKLKVLFILSLIFVAGLCIKMVIKSDDKTSADKENIDAYSYKDVIDQCIYLASDESKEERVRNLVDPLYLSDKVDVKFIREMAGVLAVKDTTYTGIVLSKAEDEYLTKEEFDLIYENMADSLTYIEKKTVFVDKKEILNFSEDLEYKGYQGKIIDVYAKNGIIFKIRDLSSATYTLENVYVIKGGEEVSFLSDETKYKMPSFVSGIEDGKIISVTFSNEGITEINGVDGEFKDKILSVTKQEINMKTNGSWKLSDKCVVYNNSADQVSREELGNLLIQYKSVDLYSKEGSIVAVVVNDSEKEFQNIRVLISDQEFSMYTHKNLQVSSSDGYSISVNDTDSTDYEADHTFSFNRDSYNAGDIIKVRSLKNNGKILIKSLNRNGECPEYRGVIELKAVDGGFIVVNELGLEEYCYGVVSSEAKSDLSKEALKSLAVSARAYAYSSIKSGAYSDYSANLDDSSFNQLYNFLPENDMAIEAVNETAGVIPLYKDECIIPYTFLCSAGITLLNSDVYDQVDFAYIEANIETEKKEKADLSDENNFRNFINQKTSYDLIEKDLPYFRWKVTMTKEEMTKAVENRLAKLYENELASIAVKEGDKYVYKVVDSLGDINEIKISKRSSSGAILEMIVAGSKNEIKVTGNVNFVNLIINDDTDITLNDGSVIEDRGSLPSSVYYVSKTDGGFEMIGGGFGSGVGLSQCGADLLAKKGYSYIDILDHYYSSLSFKNIYTGQAEK